MDDQSPTPGPTVVPAENVVAVYLCAGAGAARLWLRDGVTLAPANAQPSARSNRVRAWLYPAATCPDAVDGVWLVAAVSAVGVTVADWDLAAAAAAAPTATLRSRLSTLYATTVVPLADYRAGQFRRPEVLIPRPIGSDVLAPLPPTSLRLAVTNATEYLRQLRQALRAMVGAPVDAPLAALVAAAVARGRAVLLGLHTDVEGPIATYAVDGESWYFTLPEHVLHGS